MNLFKGTVVLTISSLCFMLVGYVINIYLGRVLGASQYGFYGIIISLMTLINVIQTSGLPQATSKFIAEGREEPDTILRSSFYIQIASTLFISVLFIALSHPISLLFKDTSLAPYIRFSALILPFYGIFALYTGYYNGKHEFRKQALMNIVYSLAKVVGVIAFVFLFHLYGAILGFIVAPVIALFFGFHWPSALRNFPYKKLIYFSLPIIGFSILAALPISLDLFFVKSLLHDNHLTGLYNAVGNVADIPFYALGAFALVLFPSISKLTSQNNHEEAKSTIENALRTVFIILVPASAMLSAGSRGVLRLLYSSSYVEASPALSILAVGIGFLTLFTILANILNGSGRARWSVAHASIGIIVIAISCFILVPRFGIKGAAVSTSLGCLMAFVMSYSQVRKIFGAGFKPSTIVKVVTLSAIIYLVVAKVAVSIILLPFFYLILFTLYLFILYLIREITQQDLKLIRGIAKI